MTSQQILQSDFLDILFDNRNKEYGAYALRKQYGVRMIKALAIAMCFLFVLLFLPRFFDFGASSIIVDDEYTITTTNIPLINPKVEPPRVTPPKATQFKSADFRQIKLVDTDVPPLTTQDDLLRSVVSDITVDGPEIKSWVEPAKSVATGAGTEVTKVESPKEIKPDKQPQFPGGMQAWAAFLNGNLRAPQELENGEKRIVNIRFHVDVDGVVTNFQIVQSGGTAFDNEVIRVLKRMPKWMPALQAGRPVAISFTQPVTFVGAEE
ncbi:MAG: TonB family protein [Flavisolibacter sp.]|jgi:protein TonB|nr:TonB family protein [Flavisolibacter sp.]